MVLQAPKPTFNTASILGGGGGGGFKPAVDFHDDEITDEDVIEKPPALKDLDIETQKTSSTTTNNRSNGGVTNRITNRVTEDEFDF